MTAIADWKRKIDTALDVLTSITASIASSPSGGDPAERLEALESIWNRFRVNQNEHNPIAETARRWSHQIAGNNARENLFDAVTGLLLDLERAIAVALDNGAKSDTAIRSKDFADLRFFDSGATNTATGERTGLVAGIVDSLPPGHRLLKSVEGLDLYKFDGRGALVLGPCQGSLPRPWYAVDEAVRLTKVFRGRQRVQEDEAEQSKRKELEQERHRWWGGPLGELERKRLELERQRAAGIIPDQPEYQPAVRVGRH